jgi:hypothetical protein
MKRPPPSLTLSPLAKLLPSGKEPPRDGRRVARRFCTRVISMKQTSDVPQTATPNAAIALVIVCSGSVALGGAWLCAAKGTRNGRHWSLNMAIPFIDHSNGM